MKFIIIYLTYLKKKFKLFLCINKLCVDFQMHLIESDKFRKHIKGTEIIFSLKKILMRKALKYYLTQEI